MPEKTIPLDEYDQANGDPRQIDGIRETLSDNQESPNLDDIRPPKGFTIAGLACRTFSAGVLALLEEINHPLFLDDDSAEVRVPDVVNLLFILTHPDVEELVDWVEDGTIYRHAKVWSFELEPDQIDEAEVQLQVHLDKAGKEMARNAGPDEGSGKKN